MQIHGNLNQSVSTFGAKFSLADLIEALKDGRRQMSALSQYHDVIMTFLVGVGFISVLRSLSKIEDILDSIRSDGASQKYTSELCEINSHLSDIDFEIKLHLSNIEDRLSEIALGIAEAERLLGRQHCQREL